MTSLSPAEIAKATALEAWQLFKERIICGETFARELEPLIVRAIEEASK